MGYGLGTLATALVCFLCFSVLVPCSFCYESVFSSFFLNQVFFLFSYRDKSSTPQAPNQTTQLRSGLFAAASLALGFLVAAGCISCCTYQPPPKDVDPSKARRLFGGCLLLFGGHGFGSFGVLLPSFLMNFGYA